ncbi:MAG: disulfide oxidoreductase [Vicinamibacteria bacterium]|jgi:ATP-dependent RNA helicase SUPV3L1/SUV3|nr:disulfide oxidoreductase [Vicinamibacteria bacterium]
MRESPIVALLGPTNTGKTYHAIERMLLFETGMIGFPLRLLARENYERLVAARGRDAVALITGEEQIVPRDPRYFSCTVEAMPVDRRMDFLAVDEIQMAADRERGHVFTDRLLNARGRCETMFMGAETIRPLLRALLKDAECRIQPRLSTLRYVEPKKLSRLPRRSALIGFSVAEVYALAERLRSAKGGAALVFGALSPRTRNAQVGLYQAGEVDYLVATDAIGMGLNLDIDHVCFTALVKHDGLGPRPLASGEVAQIAGRAGRHVKDGTFGATTELGPFDRELIEAIENHRFPALSSIYWRNSDLDCFSPQALLASLTKRSTRRELIRMTAADDQRALETLMKNPEVMALAKSRSAVEQLWEVCRVPDFRKVMTDAHTRLLSQIYVSLMKAGRLAEDFVAAQVAALDRVDGDIEVLLARIAHIRTWTYISHRSNWLLGAAFWQERARAVEDRLSDALHERLTEQFVDRHAAVLARLTPDATVITIDPGGQVLVQGLPAGRLAGLRFVPDEQQRARSGALLAAANRALRAHIDEYVAGLLADDARALRLTPVGQIEWRGGAIGRLARGESPLAPRVDVVSSDLLSGALRERVRKHLDEWLTLYIQTILRPLIALSDGDWTAGPRGVVFALTRQLGSVERHAMGRQIAGLSRQERQRLLQAGIVLGRFSVYLPSLLAPQTLELRATLSHVHNELRGAVPALGRLCLALNPALSSGICLELGYFRVAGQAVRVDALERLLRAADRHVERRSGLTGALDALLGCDREVTQKILTSLGYALDADARLTRKPRGRRATGGKQSLEAGRRV